MSDRMPEDLPDKMPENMPEHMPEDMPDRMPDRMPEDMSDRMPEGLPVRKCINAMVGIIRSEFFFFNQICPDAFWGLLPARKKLKLAIPWCFFHHMNLKWELVRTIKS